MQIEVDNEILAALIDAHFGVKHKISLNSEKKNSISFLEKFSKGAHPEG